MSLPHDRLSEKVWIWSCPSCHANNTRAVPGSTKGGEMFSVRCAQCGASSFEVAAPANLLTDRRKAPRPVLAPGDSRALQDSARARETSRELHERSREAIAFAELVVTESAVLREHVRQARKLSPKGGKD